MAELRDKWTAEDFARGEAVLKGWSSDQRSNTYADSFRGVLAMQANADTLYPGSFVSELLGPVTLGSARELAIQSYRNPTKDEPSHDHARGQAYLANIRAMRMIFNQARQVTGGPVFDVPTVPAAIPLVVAGAVVGVAAVIGATWWGVDRNTKQAEVSKVAAIASAEAQIYVARVKAAVDTNTPIPDPPDIIERMASAEASSGIWLAGAGAILGAVAVGSVWYAASNKRPAYVRANPTRRRRNAAARPRVTRRPLRPSGANTRRPRARPGGRYVGPLPRRQAGVSMRANPKRKRKAAPRLTPKRRSILSIANNRWQEDKASASFINADERKTVAELDKLGWLSITSRGKSPGGRTEIYAKITAAGRAAIGVRSNPNTPKRKRNASKKYVTHQRAYDWLISRGFKPVAGSSRYKNGVLTGRIEPGLGSGDNFYVTIQTPGSHVMRAHPSPEKMATPTLDAIEPAPKRKNPKRKAPKRSNPLRAGYSRAAVAANVAEMKRAGYPKAQAVAAAMRSARAAYRKKTKRGGFPAHLQTAAERKGHKKTARKKTTRKKARAGARRRR